MFGLFRGLHTTYTPIRKHLTKLKYKNQGVGVNKSDGGCFLYAS